MRQACLVLMFKHKTKPCKALEAFLKILAKENRSHEYFRRGAGAAMWEKGGNETGHFDGRSKTGRGAQDLWIGS